ncbi:MAG: hypothetical protein V4507_12960 [Verrucomicrobiota bacterium]
MKFLIKEKYFSIFIPSLLFLILGSSSSFAILTNSSGTDDQRFLSWDGNDVPTENKSSSFVGAGYDWSGVGWIRDYQSQGGLGSHTGFMNFAMLTPRDFGSARHYKPIAGDTVHLFNGTNVIDEKVSGIAYAGKYDQTANDLYMGSLQTAVGYNSGTEIYRILDVSSNNYLGMQVLVTGNDLNTATGLSVATAHIIKYPFSGTDQEFPKGYLYYLASEGDTWVDQQGGDSGSPTFIAYNGQLTYAGACYSYGISSTVLWDGQNASTVHDTDPSILMNSSLVNSGYALRWTVYDEPGDPANTANVWSGTNSGNGNISAGGNWNKGTMENNKPVVFDSSISNIKTSVNIDSDQSVRGILFRSNSGPNGFTFSGSGTLSIDRTGIRNEDTNTQTFNNNIINC